MREKCFGAGSPLSSSREGRRRLGEPLPHQLADNRLPAQSTSPHSRSGRAHALETLSLIAAHNRCASGVRAALPAYHFPRLTLTSGMSQFGPASGSHRDSGPHHYCGLQVRSVRFSASLESLLLVESAPTPCQCSLFSRRSRSRAGILSHRPDRTR